MDYVNPKTSFVEVNQINGDIKTLDPSNRPASVPKSAKSKKSFVCEVCCENFDSKAILTEHIQHHEEFECLQCYQRFPSIDMVERHVNSDHSLHPAAFFKCPMCHKSFSNKRRLHFHKKQVHHKKYMTCPKCNYTNSNRETLKKHLRESHSVKPYSCKLCNYSSFYRNCLDSHMDTSHSELHKCNHCKKAFALEAHLRRHVALQHAEDPQPNVRDSLEKVEEITKEEPDLEMDYVNPETSFVDVNQINRDIKTLDPSNEPASIPKNVKSKENFVCEVCYENFDSKAILTEHIQHHEEFECLQCYQRFPSKDMVERHVNKDHPLHPAAFFICPLCHKSFFNKRRLHFHKKQVHHKKYLTCPKCSYINSDREGLKKHLRESHAVKPYSCKLCNYSSFYRHSLHSHMDSELHNLDKHSELHKCNYCKKAFTLEVYLRRHVARQHGEKPKPHVCHVCNASFAWIGSLSKHMSLHQPDHQCESCGKAFDTSRKVEIHIKNVHLKIKYRKCGICEKSFSKEKYLKAHLEKVHDKGK